MIAFVVSIWPFLGLPPPADNSGTLWMVRNIPWWSFLTDPLSAGYSFFSIFDPGFALLHYVVLALLPAWGLLSFHVPGIVGSVLAAVVLAHLVRIATHRIDVACAAAALFLLGLPTWYNVAASFNFNYQWATALGLSSLVPAWRSYWKGEPKRWTATWASAAAYGVGLIFKPSIAGLPLLILGLAYAGCRSWPRALVGVLPHAIVLALMLAWNTHLLGGLGGYFAFPQVEWLNPILALPTLLLGTWGYMAFAVPLVLAALLWRRGLAGFAILGTAASLAPFLLADEVGFTPDVGLWAGRLVLTWAILLLYGCTALASLKRPSLLGLAVVGLLLVQLIQRPGISEMHEDLRPPPFVPTRPWTRPVAIVNSDCFRPYVEYLLHPEATQPLQAYCHPVLWWLDEALGHHLPADTVRVGFPEGGFGGARAADNYHEGASAVPRTKPLAMEGIALWADAQGRVHLRIPAEMVNKLVLALVYENGGARVIVGYAVGRTRVDFPLNYSARAVWLFRIPPGDAMLSEPWPVHVWQSPFFTNPYPLHDGHLQAASVQSPRQESVLEKALAGQTLRQ